MLAGASLDVSRLAELGWIGAIYVTARSVGIYVGIRCTGVLVAAPVLVRRWLGLALLPQAGVAIGMALLASQRFLPIVLASTVLFELTAPIITRRVLQLAGATNKQPEA